MHDPDAVDYEAILEEFDLLARVESDQIDEVWLFGFPYAGFYESHHGWARGLLVQFTADAAHRWDLAPLCDHGL